MASTINLLLIPFLFILISTVSSQPPVSPLSPQLSPQPEIPTLFQEDKLNSSQEDFTLYNTSPPPPLPPPPRVAEPPFLPPEIAPMYPERIQTPPPLPRIQEPLNSSQEVTLNNTSKPVPLPRIEDPLDFSQEFILNKTSTPPPLPGIQEQLNSTQLEFTLHNTSTLPPLPRIQEQLNSTQEFTLHNTSILPPLPRIQEPFNSSQEFTLNNTATTPLEPFMYPSIIETTPPTPSRQVEVPPLDSLNSSAITTTPLPTRAPLVPAFFILGDSSVDCGTNNFLGTLARADRPPYGRDFDTHQPTGRFCNGRIPVDFLALRLGLPFVPSYLGQNGTVKDMLQGVNYASAGAGIIFSSGLELGQRVSFTQQIQQFTDTLQTFIVDMGEDAATDLISKSVFYISVGINDYIHYYLRNASNVQNLYLPWSFNQFLAYTLKNEIKNLYAMSVRKVVVMGLPPIGCAPHYLWKYRSQDGKCIQEINDMILEFNFIMRYVVQGLRGELPGANVIFCDVYEASMDIIENSAHYGFNVTTDACCGWGRFRGWIMCISPEMACNNASNHIWWDQYHPTDAVNAILADNVWNGLHAKICYPMGLEEMVTAKAK